MRIRADRTRLYLGFRGLALLRDWPTGDPEVAAAHIEVMRALLDGRDAPGEIEIDDHGLAAAYELWATFYDDEPNGLIEVEELFVEALVADLPEGVVIDAACGTGRHAALLSSLGHDVIGVERSAAMLDVARRKGIAGRFLLGDLHALPLADASADLAICGLALTHVTDLGPPIAELARIVRPGGHVLLTDIHPIAAALGGQAQPGRPDGTRMLARNHVHWASDYIAAFRDAGLEIVRCEEPRAARTFLHSIEHAELREHLEAAVLGLPLAMIWLLRRR